MRRLPFRFENFCDALCEWWHEPGSSSSLMSTEEPEDSDSNELSDFSEITAIFSIMCWLEVPSGTLMKTNSLSFLKAADCAL